MSKKPTNFSRDLLQRFTGSKNPTRPDPDHQQKEEELFEDELLLLSEEDDPELNLGLSLNGRFGIDKSKLIRSSSIAAILPKYDDVLISNNKNNKNNTFSKTTSYSGLTRTASLPVETEEEWRKRKELQSLRRLAAKRRRSEKQKKVEREEYVAAMGRVGSSVGPSLGSGNWDFFIATSTTPGGSVVESQASTVSEFECRQPQQQQQHVVQGSSNEGEVSPTSVQSSQEPSNQNGSSSSKSKVIDPVVRPSKPKPETPNPSNNKGKEIRSNSVEMPCVFTQGDGPAGRRIEGILYKYGKGEEVKIMCVCHGSFLTPAEFVRHAGGTDVVHPLKHIVVNPNSSSYL